MTTKAVISRSYPHLSDFFFTKLDITNAPPLALVNELRMIAEMYQSVSIPPGVQEHVADILADISDMIEKMPSVTPSLAALAQIAAFPVQDPRIGIALRTAEQFYVPGKCADVFRGRVMLLDLPESTPIARIRPLLGSDIFKDRIRYLDEHVTKRSVPQGNRVLDSNATELYSNRVDHIARYVQNAVAAAGRERKVLMVSPLYQARVSPE
jgi:hypothetical protein